MSLTKALLIAAAAVAACLTLLASVASAQTGDVILRLESGTYAARVQAPPEADVARVCVVDDSTLAELACEPAGPSEVVAVRVTVTCVTGVDVFVRAVADDLSGNRSVPSDRRGRIDCTPPSAPILEP